MYKSMKFGSLSIYYSVGLIILSFMIGILLFNEEYNTKQYIGLILAFLAILFIS